MILVRHYNVPMRSFYYLSIHRHWLFQWPAPQMAVLGCTRRKHQITYKAYLPPCYKDHDQKNMTLRRPMSPHLTIYAPTLTAMTSIAQRITGTIVTCFSLLLSAVALFLPNGVESFVSMMQSMDLSRVTVFMLKIMIGAPFAYHYFIGIRFVLWNAGKFLSMKHVYDTANKAFIATGVITLLFAIL